jgi:hypothetical protein
MDETKLIMTNRRFHAPDAESDEELIAMARMGDADAFSRLIDRYRDRAIRTAYGMLHSTEDAEDVAQEAFVRVYGSIRGYKGGGSFFTWLYRIFVNLCISRRRGSCETACEMIDIEGSIEDPEERSVIFVTPTVALTILNYRLGNEVGFPLSGGFIDSNPQTAFPWDASPLLLTLAALFACTIISLIRREESSPVTKLLPLAAGSMLSILILTAWLFSFTEGFCRWLSWVAGPLNGFVLVLLFTLVRAAIVNHRARGRGYLTQFVTSLQSALWAIVAGAILLYVAGLYLLAPLYVVGVRALQEYTLWWA